MGRQGLFRGWLVHSSFCSGGFRWIAVERGEFWWDSNWQVPRAPQGTQDKGPKHGAGELPVGRGP